MLTKQAAPMPTNGQMRLGSLSAGVMIKTSALERAVMNLQASILGQYESHFVLQERRICHAQHDGVDLHETEWRTISESDEGGALQRCSPVPSSAAGNA